MKVKRLNVTEDEQKVAIAGTIAHAIKRNNRIKQCVEDDDTAVARLKHQEDYKELRDELYESIFGE